MSTPTTDLETEIKNVIKSGKVVLGFKRSLKAILYGKAKAVIVASKIPKGYDDDINHYAKLSNIPVIKYPKSSVELGIICGKPFPVTTIAVIDLGSSRLLELIQGGS